jgi:hypothetical protein
LIFFIISRKWISVSVSSKMFQSAISPIRDTKGDDTINIVSTPYFPDSPASHAIASELEPITKTKLCLRLFEDSSVNSVSSDWTTDSSLNDWTTDSEAESQESEIPFGWCATP